MHREHAVEARHFEALGTRCALFRVGATRARLQEAESWVRWMGKRFTRFDPDSELSVLNSRPGRWQAISEDLESLLAASMWAFERSRGLVNVAVERTMIELGYDRPWSERAPTVTAHDGRPLAPLPEVLALRPGSAWLVDGFGIDLGGIAKGWMADRLAQRFATNVLVNIGGDLSARGPGPFGGGWPVFVAGRTLLLDGAAVATSSVRRRRWGDSHHLIDPRTGMPSDTGLGEVSVVAGDGVAAEVIAKTALLLGPVDAPPYCATAAMAWAVSP